MLRFSDRLMSASAPTAEVKLPSTNPAPSDEADAKPATSPEQEYSRLVGLIGLHQTVKILEAEYSLVAGGDGKGASGVCDALFGKCPGYEALMLRANELRDILGIAKCTALLSKILADQSEGMKRQSLSEEMETPAPSTPTYPKAPFTLRPEANEWTPPAGTESPSTILKRVLHIGDRRPVPTPATPDNTLLLPIVPNPSVVGPAYPAGTYYYPPPLPRSRSATDLTGNGKEFISSLSSKRELSPPTTPPKPIAPPNKRPAPPPGLRYIPYQQPHSFPLTVSLLPQTFSVHLLSTLHKQFEHVSAALQNLDSTYANEISKSGCTQPPGPTRWETWMIPEGAAAMSQALRELRKSLDELCGATARATWIVDTWGEYQDGKYDGTKPSEVVLGSADIKGEEFDLENEIDKAAQAPIGHPPEKKLPTTDVQQKQYSTVIPGMVIPALPVVHSIRPPPGLHPSIGAFDNASNPKDTPKLDGSKFFLSLRPVGETNKESSEKQLGSGGKSVCPSGPNTGR